MTSETKTEIVVMGGVAALIIWLFFANQRAAAVGAPAVQSAYFPNSAPADYVGGGVGNPATFPNIPAVAGYIAPQPVDNTQNPNGPQGPANLPGLGSGCGCGVPNSPTSSQVVTDYFVLPPIQNVQPPSGFY